MIFMTFSQPVQWIVPGPDHVHDQLSCPPLWKGNAACGFQALTGSQTGMNSKDMLLAPCL